MMKKKQFRYVISVLSPYSIGVLSKITSEIADLLGNIDGINQALVEGYLTVLFTVTFYKEIDTDLLCQNILENLNNDISIVIRRHVVNLEVNSPFQRDNYIITLAGTDRPGILKVLTTFLEERKIKINEYFFKIEGEKVTHIGLISIPRILDIKQIKDELENILSSISISVSLHHENIFKATNEVCSISHFLRSSQ